MKISTRTKICGIIGDPVEHSLSPTIHNAAFEELKLDLVYIAFRVKREHLRGVAAGIRSLDILGINVTMPHKMAVVKHLDKLETNARSIGAVNTILNDAGRLIGYNTDGLGAFSALKANGVNPKGKKLLLLGTGGAGKSIAFNAAQEVGELTMLNRTPNKARKLAEALNKKLDKKVIGDKLTTKMIARELKDTDILINATSIGMHPNIDQSLVPKELLRSDLCVMDIVYIPLETKLAKDAASVGAKVVSGIDMLVHQGAASFEIWTRRSAPIESMKRAVLREVSGLGAEC
jgi:shikimate dehydrogenase